MSHFLFQIKFTIKNAIAHILFYSGILFVIKALKLKNKAVVLMYHRVLDKQEGVETFSHPGIIVKKSTFEKQMGCLKKYFHVVTEHDFLSKLQGNSPFHNSTCFITFDDGWFDNYTNAYPILKKKNLSATIFLATDYIGTDATFWQEKLASELFTNYYMEGQCDMSKLKHYQLGGIVSQTPQNAKIKIREFITRLKQKDSTELNKVLNDFFDQDESLSIVNTEKKLDTFINWEHVTEMSQNNISFGSHSVHHHILTKVPLDIAISEIQDSRKVIIQRAKLTPNIFCYPNGDFSTEISKQVSEAGYHAAVSTQNGHIDTKDYCFALPRMNIHEEATNNIPLFMTKILGLF